MDPQRVDNFLIVPLKVLKKYGTYYKENLLYLDNTGLYKQRCFNNHLIVPG